jgi:hypothetical protein
MDAVSRDLRVYRERERERNRNKYASGEDHTSVG